MRYTSWKEDLRRMRTVSVDSEKQCGKRERKRSSDSDKLTKKSYIPLLKVFNQLSELETVVDDFKPDFIL